MKVINLDIGAGGKKYPDDARHVPRVSGGIVGDALLYVVFDTADSKPYFGALEPVPDGADNEAPKGVINVVDAGVNGNGCRVILYQYAYKVNGVARWGVRCAIGAPTRFRFPAGGGGGDGGQGIPGPQGQKGDRGPQGERGPAGAPGQGDDMTDEEMAKLADMVAERVLTRPSAPDHFGLPEGAQFGREIQELIAYVLLNPGVIREWIRRVDTEAFGLLGDGYQPKVAS
jgi:hypothetical protein